MTIEINQLTMAFGGKLLFEGVDLQLQPGHRYGLVGANGSGKSTFFKLLSGEISADRGLLQLPKDGRMGMLQQDLFRYEERDLVSIVMMGNQQLWKVLEQQRQLLATEGHWSEQECRRWEQLEEELLHAQGYSGKSRAEELLSGLGIEEERHQRPLKELSGGYRLRVMLAQLLFAEADILLLDEPTNHLDLFSIRWLEQYLRSFRGLLVVSSHDRKFLETVATDILDLDYETIRLYPMDYSSFIEEKGMRTELLEQRREAHEKRQEKLLFFVDRFRAKSSKARQAQSKLKLVEKLHEEVASLEEKPSSRKRFLLRFDTDQRCNEQVLRVEGLAKSYGERHLFSHLDMEILRGDRVAFVGVNGIGKTTLLELLTGYLPPDAGSIHWGAQSRWDYFPQDPRRLLPMEATPLEWLERLFPSLPSQQLRSALGQLLLTQDQQKQTIATLSGGERARLLLAKMVVSRPNVLLFDEPTNHLDLEGIDALLEGLSSFHGAVLLVSHNRWLIGRFANRIVELQKGGLIDWRGEYDQFIARHERDLLAPAPMARSDKLAEPERRERLEAHQQRRDRKKQLVQLQKGLHQAEREIQQLEAEKQQLEQAMAQSDFFAKASVEEKKGLLQRQKQIDRELESSLQAWEQSYELQQQLLAEAE